MIEEKDYSKEAFIRFVMCSSEFISSDKQHAIEYLEGQGLNVKAIINEGMKKIKKLQLQINAEKNRKEMIQNESVRQKAEEWVDKLLVDVGFSFLDFVKEKKLVLHNRNLQSLTPNDIRKTLVEYFLLEFLQSNNRKSE